MNKSDSIILGVITGTGVGLWLFQALSILVLAIIGAAGGWIFHEYLKPMLKPKFDKLFKKKKG